MTKFIFTILLLLSLAGCSDVKVERDVIDDYAICINGNLYYRASGYGYAPLFDYRADTPILVKCKKHNGRIKYEREKVK